MSLDVSAFRHLAANSPLFFGAVVLGYHRQAVGAWWQSHRAGRVVDVVVVAVGVALFIGFVLDYGGNEAVGEFFGSFEVREFLMPPHNLLIVLVYLRILWLLTTRLWPLLHRLGGWLFIPLQKWLTLVAHHRQPFPKTRSGPHRRPNSARRLRPGIPPGNTELIPAQATLRAA